MGIEVSSYIFMQLHDCPMWLSSLSYNLGKRWVFPAHVSVRGRRKLVESSYRICILQSLPGYEMSTSYLAIFSSIHIQQGDRGRVIGNKVTHFCYPGDSIHYPLWRIVEAFDMTDESLVNFTSEMPKLQSQVTTVYSPWKQKSDDGTRLRQLKCPRCWCSRPCPGVAAGFQGSPSYP